MDDSYNPNSPSRTQYARLKDVQGVHQEPEKDNLPGEEARIFKQVIVCADTEIGKHAAFEGMHIGGGFIDDLNRNHQVYPNGLLEVWKNHGKAT